MALIILFLVVGSIASVLVGFFLTEPLMARGSRSLGFWAGLLVLISMFGVGQYFWAHYYRTSFGRSGPSANCELCGLPIIFWGASWALGFIIYLVISAKWYKQYSQITPLPTPRWLKIGGPLGIFCVIMGVIGFNLLGDYSERTNLRYNIAKIENSVLSGNLTNIGSIQLPQSADYWTFGILSYVIDLEISPDGEWLSLTYPHKVELWDLSDIARRKVFHSESSIYYVFGDRFAFSPDSSKYAVGIDGKLSVYMLGEDIGDNANIFL